MDEKPDINVFLFQLIISHEAAAMQFMGKIAGADGKVEKNLEMARYAIDTLEALREKTRGNLTDEEKRLLEHTLYQLHLNFVDESNAAKQTAAKSSSETPQNQPPDANAAKQPGSNDHHGPSAPPPDA